MTGKTKTILRWWFTIQGLTGFLTGMIGVTTATQHVTNSRDVFWTVHCLIIIGMILMVQTWLWLHTLAKPTSPTVSVVFDGMIPAFLGVATLIVASGIHTTHTGWAMLLLTTGWVVAGVTLITSAILPIMLKPVTGTRPEGHKWPREPGHTHTSRYPPSPKRRPTPS